MSGKTARGTSILASITAFLAFSIPNAPLHAQEHRTPCDDKYIKRADTVPARNFRYGPRKGDERCEGIYGSEDRSQPSLMPVSFFHNTRASPFFTKPPDNVINIVPLRNFDEPVMLTVVPTLPEVFYRMDAYLPRDRAFKWPLDAVVKPRKIDIAHLGLIGTLPKKGVNVYVPLATSNMTAPDSKLYFVLQSTGELESVSWSLRKAHNDTCAEGTPQASGKAYNLNNLYHIEFSPGSGKYHLQINAWAPNDRNPIRPCYTIII